MNEKEKREYYQRVHSKNAVEVDAPAQASKKRENLAAIVSLRFSGYELALLRKLSKKREMTLSALIRSLVLDSIKEEQAATPNNLVFLPNKTLTGTPLSDPKSIQEKERSQTLRPVAR